MWYIDIFPFVENLFIKFPIISWITFGLIWLISTELFFYMFCKDDPYEEHNSIFWYVMTVKFVSIFGSFICLFAISFFSVELVEVLFILIISIIKYFKIILMIIGSLVILYPYYYVNKRIALKNKKIIKKKSKKVTKK